MGIVLKYEGVKLVLWGVPKNKKSNWDTGHFTSEVKFELFGVRPI